MDELISEFKALVESYPERLKAIENPNNIMGFTSYDIFSLEPFHIELDHVTPYQLQIYQNQNELSANSRIYACILQNGVLVQVREFIDQQVYRDSIFTLNGQNKWRYEVYVNNEEIRPEKVECLTYDENGHFKKFRSYSQDIYTEITYANRSNHIQMNSLINFENNQKIRSQFLVYRDKKGIVSRIEEIKAEFKDVVYEEKLKHTSIEELLVVCNKNIVDSILKSLTAHNKIQEEIYTLLLEYNLQTPFPPTVALGKYSEFKSCQEDGESLSFYNAPDLHYFSEEESLKIDFTGEAVFAELKTKLIAEYSQKKLDKVVFEFYLKLAKSLKRKLLLKQLIPLHKQFHVTARDFEQGNEWDFLQLILKKKEIKQIEKEIEKHETDYSLTERDKVYFKLVERTLNQREQEFEALEGAINLENSSIFYCKTDPYFLQPFYREIQDGIYLDYHSLYPEKLSNRPTDGNYFQAIEKDHRIIAVYLFNNNQVENVKFYHHKSLQIDEYYFSLHSDRPELISFSRLSFNESAPSKYFNYSKIRVHESLFDCNSDGNIVKSHDTGTLYSADSKMKSSSDYIYEYHNGAISRITSYYKGIPTVVFTTDQYFLTKHQEYVVEYSVKSILNYLIIRGLEENQLIAICRDRTSPFPIDKISIESSQQSNKSKDEIDLGTSTNQIVSVYSDLTKAEYIDPFEYYEFKSKTKKIIDDVFNSTADLLTKKILEDYGFDIVVKVKSLEE